MNNNNNNDIVTIQQSAGKLWVCGCFSDMCHPWGRIIAMKSELCYQINWRWSETILEHSQRTWAWLHFVWKAERISIWGITIRADLNELPLLDKICDGIERWTFHPLSLKEMSILLRFTHYIFYITSNSPTLHGFKRLMHHSAAFYWSINRKKLFKAKVPVWMRCLVLPAIQCRTFFFLVVIMTYWQWQLGLTGEGINHGKSISMSSLWYCHNPPTKLDNSIILWSGENAAW